MKSLRMTVLGLGLVFAAPVHAATTPPETLRTRAAAIDTYVTRLGPLGWSGTFVLEAGGKLLVERSCGLADREKRTPWRSQTVSDLGSITKQFTAAAILRLQEQGRLRVQDPLAQYIPSVPADKSAITLHHLLTHTSGIVDVPDKDDWDPVSRDEIIKLTMAAPLASEPGTRYAYSNAGYSLLGVVIETLTGTSYEKHVQSALFAPAGMKETGYVLPKWKPDRIAIGYENGKRWGTTLERPFASDGPYWILRANGGLHSTTGDMRRWAHALLENRVLTAASRQALWTQHADESNGNRDSFYGYGWTVDTLQDGRTMAKHSGGNTIFFADYAIEPTEKIVVFLMTNVASEFPSNQILEDVVGHMAMGTPLPEVPAVVPMTPEVTRVAGTYRVDSSRGTASLEVRIAGDALTVESTSWRELARLYGAPESALDRLESQSRTVDEFVQALLRGDYAPQHAAYDGRVAVEVLRERGEARLRSDAETYGPLKKTRTLGTIPTSEGSMTFVRFEHERGTHHRRYVWNEAGKLRGMSASRREGPPRFYLVKGTVFDSFEVGFPSAQIAFGDAREGVSLEYGVKREHSAFGPARDIRHVPAKN